MLKEISTDTEARMKKTGEAFAEALAKIRTGRAHPSLLAGIQVLYYGNMSPLAQVSNIKIEDARTLTIEPWDKNLSQDIDKAIRSAGLGLNPSTAGSVIRVPLPPLTEERRKDMVKQTRSIAEESKVATRNIRRDAITQIKDLLKAKKITEDEVRKGEESIQKLTDKFINEIDKATAAKETELMQV